MNSDILVISTKSLGASNNKEMFEVIEKNKLENLLEEAFNVEYSIIKYLFLNGVINEDWIDLMHR